MVAWHDRLGTNGRGCYAGRDLLAREVGIDATSVSRSLTNLERENIIESTRDPKDRRRRIYRMKYLTNPRISDNRVTYSPAGATETEVSGSRVTHSPVIGDKAVLQVSELKEGSGSNKGSPGKNGAEALSSAEEASLIVELGREKADAVTSNGYGGFLANLPMKQASTVARRHAAKLAEWFDGELPEVKRTLDIFVDVFGPVVIHRALAAEREGSESGYRAICEAAADHLFGAGRLACSCGAPGEMNAGADDDLDDSNKSRMKCG